MSSTISQTELKTLMPTALTPLKMEDRQGKLVRSSSIDKIRRFNSFICSQQYYILPAILSWLKSSQSGLQISTKKTIFFFRSLFFKSLLYKYFLISLKSKEWSSEQLLSTIEEFKAIAVENFHDTYTKCFESTFLLIAAVYGACAIVLVQLLTTLYLLYFTLVPYGMVFLVGCMLTIKYICYKTIFFYLCKSTKCK